MRNAIAIAAAAALLAVSLSAQAADKVSLRTDWIKSAYHAIWYHAKDKGVFAKNGIDVDIRDGRGSVITAQTVGNKTVTFGTADGGAVMVLVSKGLPVKIVSSYLRTNPVAIIFPEEERLEELEGPRGLPDRLLGGRRDGGLFQGARQEERDRGQGQAGIHGARRQARRAVDGQGRRDRFLRLPAGAQGDRGRHPVDLFQLRLGRHRGARPLADRP